MDPRIRPQPVEWVLLALGLVLVWRYQWTMDDAFVYARYGDNLVLSRFGLVYNQGEFVEGFSSPLWMMWLLPWRALGLSYGAIWLVTGLLSFVAAWWIAVVIAARMGPSGPRINVPLAYLAANYGVASFFTSGLETPFVQLVAFGYALFLLCPESKLARGLVVLSPLVRPEFVLVFGVVIGLLAARQRRIPWAVLGLGIAASGAWLTFRIWYYADLFPNTYYLKAGYQPQQGVRYLINTFWSYHLEVVAVVSVACVWFAVRSGTTALQLRARERVEMLVLAAIIVLYVARIGGDAMHYRFLAFPFCLAACAGAGLPEHALRFVTGARRRRTFPLIAGLVAAVSLSLQPPQRDVHALRGAGDPHFVDGISDPGRHRRQPQMRELAWYTDDDDAKRRLGAGPKAFRYRDVSITSWCTEAHFLYDTQIVHGLGLTDPFLARARVIAERPGHKYGLRLLADDLGAIYRHQEQEAHVGTLGNAVSEGRAKAWLGENLEQIEVIERKMYNQHRWAENLALALSFPDPIDPGSRLHGVVFSAFGTGTQPPGGQPASP